MRNLQCMGGSQLVLLDYIINLSIFSIFVSTPLVIGSFINSKPLKRVKYWAGLYGGLVSVILVTFSYQQQGYSYDIRYAIVIILFAYLGPLPGVIAGVIALIMRLFTSSQWTPAIIGCAIILFTFSLIHVYTKRLTIVKRCIILFVFYIVIYLVTVPTFFNVFRNQPFFHLQYLLFVMLGVIIGVLLIESYFKLHRLNHRLTQMYKLVEESEAKYRLIAENTSDLILVLDKEQSINYFSPSHEVVLGYESLGLERFDENKIVHPDDIVNFSNKILGMFEHKESQSIELRLKHKEGHWIDFESRCMPVRGAEDAVENIVIISRDISERKKSEELLLQSEKLSIVGELAAGVAHEIRNPLTTIKGFVQLYKAENSSIKYNDLLLSELERIENITSELLTLGKPQAIQMNRINVRKLIENTLELLAPQTLMNNVQFKLDLEEKPLIIKGESNQLKQVFLNIVKNSIEAMPNGGYIHINLLKGLGDECFISFQDQGCGIPEELLPRLGQPFYSLKEKGTGLGIMICHKILNMHNGSITYKSMVNEGTTVEITLPLIS